MSSSAENTVATFLLPRTRPGSFSALVQDMSAAMLAQGLPLEEVALQGPALVTLQLGGLRLTAALRDGALTQADYAAYRRPEGPCDPSQDEAAVDRLAEHRQRLVLSCGLAPGASDGVETAREAFRLAASCVLAQTPSAVVLWPHDLTLFTAAEFRRFLAPSAPVRSEPAAAEPDTVATAMVEPVTIEAVAAEPVPARSDGTAEVVELPRRPRAVPPKVRRIRPAVEAPANDRPDLPAMPREELARVRAALYPEPAAETSGAKGPRRAASGDDETPTLAMRLSATAMDMTLLIVALPVGAAVVTHNVLRGRTDMRLSARAMALTGAFLAFTQTGVGQVLLSVI